MIRLLTSGIAHSFREWRRRRIPRETKKWLREFRGLPPNAPFS